MTRPHMIGLSTIRKTRPRIVNWVHALQLLAMGLFIGACPQADLPQKSPPLHVPQSNAVSVAAGPPLDAAAIADEGTPGMPVRAGARNNLYCEKKSFYVGYLRDNPKAPNAARIREILEGEDMRNCP